MTTKLETTFNRAHLPTPPLPHSLAVQIRQWDEWLFGTELPDAALYDTEHFVTRAVQRADAEFALIGVSGYGVNNWHLHYYLSLEHLAVFVQVPWGGIYVDEEASREELTHCFDLIAQMIPLGDLVAKKRPYERLFAVHQLGGSRWAWVSNFPPVSDDDESAEDTSAAVDLIYWRYDDNTFAAALESMQSDPPAVEWEDEAVKPLE